MNVCQEKKEEWSVVKGTTQKWTLDFCVGLRGVLTGMGFPKELGSAAKPKRSDYKNTRGKEWG